MSRFDEEGAPLITRTLTDRWSLPIANVQHVLPLQSMILRRRWEAQQKRRAAARPLAPEPESLEPPETYDEHGERLHVHPEKATTTPHLDLKG